MISSFGAATVTMQDFLQSLPVGRFQGDHQISRGGEAYFPAPARRQ